MIKSWLVHMRVIWWMVVPLNWNQVSVILLGAFLKRVLVMRRYNFWVQISKKMPKKPRKSNWIVLSLPWNINSICNLRLTRSRLNHTHKLPPIKSLLIIRWHGCLKMEAKAVHPLFKNWNTKVKNRERLQLRSPPQLSMHQFANTVQNNFHNRLFYRIIQLISISQ